MFIQQLYTSCLAEAAYYIESAGEVAIIDPIRETAPYTQMASKRNARIKYIFETHFHADFISGHIDLAKHTGAKIIYGPNATPAYPVHNAKDGEEFKLGHLKIRVLHTPGHTMESSCYLLFDENNKEYAVFTGDTLFVGDVGRPDLLDGSGITKEHLAGLMYDSLNSKIKKLHNDVIVYPAHGPGSSCGKNIGKETWSTIGHQKEMNYYLKEKDKTKFIETLTTGITPPPQYFFEDARINKAGYDNIDTVVKRNQHPLSLDEFEKLVAEGALILDTRTPDEFETGFIPGSINIGLNGQYANWIGTLIHIETPIVLVTEDKTVEESILRAARVGYENIKGYLQGGIRPYLLANKKLDTVISIDAKTFLEYLQTGKYKALDVRKPTEYETSHVKGTEFISLNDIANDFEKLDKKQTYLTYCGGGYRSMIAISMLKARGYHNLINVHGGFGKIKNCGVDIASAVNQ